MAIYTFINNSEYLHCIFGNRIERDDTLHDCKVNCTKKCLNSFEKKGIFIVDASKCLYRSQCNKLIISVTFVVSYAGQKVTLFCIAALNS